MVELKVRVARDLSAIEALSDDLVARATHLASHPTMPGGDAMLMLAHVASPEAWANRVDAVERAGAYLDLSHEIDREPPLQLLLFWSEDWRYQHGATSDLTPTIVSEVGFLRQVLDWAWQTEPRFEDFAKDVATARARLEGILRAGKRPERTHVPCIDIDCERAPLLIKVYGERVIDDRYRCPTCGRWYDDGDYAIAQAHVLAGDGADRWVPLADAVALLDRPERTVRRWVEEGRVPVCCSMPQRRLLVWWPAMWALHCEPPERGRPRVA